MKQKKLCSFLSIFLAIVTMISCLPLGVFAAVGSAVGNEPNYSEHRGSGMSADANGVMVYDDLSSYYQKSQKNVALSTNYKTVKGNSSGVNVGSTATFDECPYLYADYAVYMDESIEGTTVKVRYGLSMMDSVYYIDHATGEIVPSEESPIELSGSYKNNAKPDYNAGFGMVRDEEGNLLYTTRHYEDKAIIFYIINHTASTRIGMEDDVSILSDYIEQGYVVVTLDFKCAEDTVLPYLDQALVSARALFDDYTTDAALADLGVVTNTNFIYFLPEGCRIERDVWFWDPSIYSVNGTMDAIMTKWNLSVSYLSESNQALEDPKIYDTLGLGSVASVEEMYAKLSQKDGSPIEYKQSLDIVYPSQPKDGYKAPLYIHEGTLEFREQNNLTGYTRTTLTSFALMGYATVHYDHPFYPFIYRMAYTYDGHGGSYGISASSAHNARAAVRCARFLAEDLGYDADKVGVTGISKATVGIAVLSVKNNKDLPQPAVTGPDNTTYDNSFYTGDILAEDGTVEKSIIQPFMYYNNDGKNEVSSDASVAYISSGGGAQQLYGSAYGSYEKVPMLLSGGIRDQYKCYDYWEKQVAWYDANATEPFLPLVQLDQGHAYPIGDDKEHGYNRLEAMISFFDAILKPEDNQAPEVLWVTPLDGTTEIPLSAEWSVGPYTPFGWEKDSYYYDQTIQIRFVMPVDPESVNEGVTITADSGKTLEGTWVASEGNALYTFECDELDPGTTYTINITSGVKSPEGVALVEERAVSFKTEGTYKLGVVADAYVSKDQPDQVFGSADKLMIGEKYTTLVTFEAENVIGAENILLKMNGLDAEAATSIAVYALANYKVDESATTYNTLTASSAWANKILVTETDVDDGSLLLDISALADKIDSGRYVTLAIVSTDTVSASPYSFTRTFDEVKMGTQLNSSANSKLYIVRASDNRVADARLKQTAGYPVTTNTPSSEFWWCRTGSNSHAILTTDPAGVSDSQVLRVWVNDLETQLVKFFNTTTSSTLTTADIGKSFRVSFDIYPVRDIIIQVGLSPVVASTGTDGLTANVFSLYDAEPYTQQLVANQWNKVSCLVTITEKMVAHQAGLLTIATCYDGIKEDARYDAFTYFENISTVEDTPNVTAASDESGKSAFYLITTNKGRALNDPINVYFDEPMDITTFDGMLVTNQAGVSVVGEWIATDEDNTSFAFVTNGLAANSVYTVSTTAAVKTLAGEACEEKVVYTMVTEGDYSLRPLATSYVSKSEPQKHFGLSVDPVMTGDKLGVMTFSAKTLANATNALMYLDVDTAKTTLVSVYALTDYKPDGTLCYNSIADKLTDANLYGTYSVENGRVTLDLSNLANKALGESVTLVFRAGYRYFHDFESPVVTKDTQYVAGNTNKFAENYSFSDQYFWLSNGEMNTAYVTPATETESQTFYVQTVNDQLTKFYNTLKTSLLDASDIGRTYRISFKLRTELNPDHVSGTVDEVALQFGYTFRQANSITYNGKKYYRYDFLDGLTERPTAVLAVGDTEWTDVSFEITVNDVMANIQGGMLAVRFPGAVSDGSVFLNTYYDDILVEECINHTMTVKKDNMILMTENEGEVDVTVEDNPVVDQERIVEEVENLDATVISYQVNKGDGKEFSMRVISGLDSLDYMNFGYEITITTEDTSKTVTGTSNKVYTSLYGGNMSYSIKEHFGYEYGALATVTGLALDSEYTKLEIRAFVTTEGGEKLYGREATLVYEGALTDDGYPAFSIEK